jgi:hypothetical protein
MTFDKADKKAADLIQKLIKQNRGGLVACPKCGVIKHVRAYELRKTFGLCKECIPRRSKSTRKNVPPKIRLTLDNKCYLCSRLTNLEVHHKDKDNSNNNSENLIVLCKYCHCSVHLGDNCFNLILLRCLDQ